MEFSHCGKVGGETFAVSCLKLLDEELNVGGDDFFASLRLGCGGKGGDVSVESILHGGFVLLGFWLLSLPQWNRGIHMPNATWRRRG
jgi:hypothetical protein